MYNLSNYESCLNEVIVKDSAEYKLILEVYEILLNPLPTTPTQAFSRVSALDSLRPQLSAVIYMLMSKLNRLNEEFYSKYYPTYTRWSIAGTKRSHAEIESQIYRDSPELLLLRYKISDHENVLEFFKSLIRSIDSNKNSTMEAWRDSNKL